MHASDVSYFRCLSVPKSALFRARRISSTSALLSVSNEREGTLCSLTRRRKAKLDNVPWDWGSGRAGDRLGTPLALRPSPTHRQRCSVLCWVKDVTPFPMGCAAPTPACYCAWWTLLPKSRLNWALLHFVLFWRIDVPSVYKCHDTLTEHWRFTSRLLFLCPYSRYISLGSNI